MASLQDYQVLGRRRSGRGEKVVKQEKYMNSICISLLSGSKWWQLFHFANHIPSDKLTKPNTCPVLAVLDPKLRKLFYFIQFCRLTNQSLLVLYEPQLRLIKTCAHTVVGRPTFTVKYVILDNIKSSFLSPSSCAWLMLSVLFVIQLRGGWFPSSSEDQYLAKDNWFHCNSSIKLLKSL